MPELVRVETADFLLTIKTTSIDKQRRVLANTLATRKTTIDEYVLKSSPAISLKQSPRTFIDGPCSLLDTQSKLDSCEQIDLLAPVFFENTVYQFEWIFLKEGVSSAELIHRSHSICSAFIFTPQESTLNARLTGTINTGNDVGWMRLPLSYEVNGKQYRQDFAFEVLPTKVTLHRDLQAIYKIIDKVYPLWRFSLAEKTEQEAESSRQRGHFPLMWLANFADLRERFEKGLKVICSAPHSRLQSNTAHIKAAKLKGRLSHKLAQKVKQDLANGQWDKRYRVEKKTLSVDTPENRFIRMAVEQCKRQLATFESALRASNKKPDKQRISDAFLNELSCWQRPLKKALATSFLKDVGRFEGRTNESLVLQQKTGYSSVYRVWQELKFYLDVFGRHSQVSMKSVAEIYEVWCFLCVKQILENRLGFDEVKRRSPKMSKGMLDELKLDKGDRGAFEFFRSSDGVKASLYHEKQYGRTTKEVRSFLLTHKPDIVLEVCLPDGQKFVWLFDAKYRVSDIKVNSKQQFIGKPSDKDISQWQDKTDEARTQSLTKVVDGVPDDAINQMHRYRDALIRLSEPETQNSYKPRKSRPVFGAFALYPGYFDQENEINPYDSAINEIGIGAFALLPSESAKNASGYEWLLRFLKSQIGGSSATKASDPSYSIKEFSERLYVKEPARIPHYGMSQTHYNDLMLTAALGPQQGRNSIYLDRFNSGTAEWYHVKQSAIVQLEKSVGTRIADEIRYLAIATASPTHSHTKQIDKIWPVKSVSLKARCDIDETQAGKTSSSSENYYLFKLGKPLTLHSPIHRVPLRNFAHSLKLTTLSRLENVNEFKDVDEVYKKLG